jgi:hypothetical protein
MSSNGGDEFLGNSGDVGVWFFFFFFFLEHFPKCNQTLENKTFFLKSFTFENV